jgi:hypothetical protein
MLHSPHIASAPAPVQATPKQRRAPHQANPARARAPTQQGGILTTIAITAAIVLLGEVVGNITVGKLLLQQARILSTAAHTINAAMLTVSRMTQQVEHLCETLASKEAPSNHE